MKSIAILLAVSCGGEKRTQPTAALTPDSQQAPKLPVPPPRDDDPWGKPSASTVDAALEPDASQREGDQQAIADALNALFRSGGVDATAGISDDDLMIVSSSTCDRKALTDLRKALVALKLDPAKSFATMQCNGGPMLKFR